MKHLEKPLAKDDPLDALNSSVAADVEDDANVDMFLNLQNIENAKMSTNSSKRKRWEEGEEATSCEQ